MVGPQERDADVRVAVLRSATGWALEFMGDPRTQSVDAGPLSLVSLEIVHRAVIAIENSEKPPELPFHGRSVALEVTAEASDSVGRRLYEEAALALSDSGLFLVPRSVPRDRTVCISLHPGVVILSTGEKSEPCGEASIAIAVGKRSEDEIVNHVGQRVAKLVRVAEDGLGDAVSLNSNAIPAAVRPAEDVATSARSGTAALAARKDSPWRVHLGAGGGALVREGGTDPLILANCDLSMPSRFGLRLQGSATWSDGQGSLSVFESRLQVGPTWTASRNLPAKLTIGVLGGVLVHRFHFDATDNGSRVDWNVSVPIQVSRRLGSLIDVELTLLPGVSGTPRDHEIFGKPAWQRSVYYIGLLAGMGVGL